MHLSIGDGENNCTVCITDWPGGVAGSFRRPLLLKDTASNPSKIVFSSNLSSARRAQHCLSKQNSMKIDERRDCYRGEQRMHQPSLFVVYLSYTCAIVIVA